MAVFLYKDFKPLIGFLILLMSVFAARVMLLSKIAKEMTTSEGN